MFMIRFIGSGTEAMLLVQMEIIVQLQLLLPDQYQVLNLFNQVFFTTFIALLLHKLEFVLR